MCELPVAALDTLGEKLSEASGINACGEMVGASYPADTTTQHAFLYTDGQIVDLNTRLSNRDAALYTLNTTPAINDRGQIVANGIVNATGGTRAFLLTPKEKHD